MTIENIASFYASVESCMSEEDVTVFADGLDYDSNFWKTLSPLIRTL